MVDDTDRQIINALLVDGRASARDVADETSIPATTVSRRLDGLVGSDCIETFTPRVNYAAFGYDVTAVFRLSVDGSGLQGVTDRLAERSNMVAVYEVTGSDDIVAIGKFRDTATMNERIKELLTDQDVRSVATDVVLRIVAEFDQFQVDLEGD